MKTFLIVYHSATGGTEQMAGAAARGASTEPDVKVVVKRAVDATLDDLLGADGCLFACPENLAAMSGLMKDFFDRTYYSALERLNGRPYAAMVCAGSDGTNAARQMERIALGWRLRPIAPALIVHTDAQTPERIMSSKLIAAADLARCEELAATLAAGLAAGIY